MRLLAPADVLPAGTLVLPNDVDLAQRHEALHDAPAVALAFPRCSDGRAYSQAVVLRGRLRYAGWIVATGEVIVDMLPLLRRCGFDAAQLLPGQTAEAAERALGYFPWPETRDRTAARRLHA